MTGGSWQLSVGLKASGIKLPPGALKSAKVNPTTQISQVLGFGVDTAQMDTEVIQDVVLDVGQSQTFNLYDGSLTDVFGDSAPLRILKSAAVFIPNGGGGDNSGVTVGGAASNVHPLFWGGTTPTQTIYPNGPQAGGGGNVGVTVSSTVKNLKITNNSAKAVLVRMVLAGVGSFGYEFFTGSNAFEFFLG